MKMTSEEELIYLRKLKKEHDDKEKDIIDFLRKTYKSVIGNTPSEDTPAKEIVLSIKEYLENIIAATPGHLYWLNNENVYLGCNDLQAKHAGLLSRKDIVNMKNKDMPWKEQAEKLNAANNKVMLTDSPITEEEFAIMKNGPRTYLSQKIPLHDKSGKVSGILGISVDISVLKEKEKWLEEKKRVVEKASKAKSEFIQNISHDLRTPLTGLVGISESYISTLSDDDTLKDVFSLIRDSSNQLHQFLEEIIESVKLDNYSELPERLTSFSIVEAVKRVMNLYKPAIVSKSLSYSIQPIENGKIIKTKLMGYPDLVTRILMNLIGNAIKFTDKGGITLSYGLVSSTKDQQTTYNLVLTVSDTGKGIPKSKHQEIFERLTRLSRNFSKSGGKLAFLSKALMRNIKFFSQL